MSELWPFRPLYSFSEQLEWFTEVLYSRTGEQRLALRSAPRQFFDYAHIMNSRQFSWAKRFAQTNSAIEVLVPAWLDAQRLGPVSSSQTKLVFDTTIGDFRLGSKLVVWQSWQSYVVATINEITTDDVTLDAAVGTDFTHPYVIPVRTALIAEGLRIDRHTTYNVAGMKFRVLDNIDLAEFGYSGFFPIFQEYEGYGVLPDAPHDVAEISENIMRVAEYIDNGFGPIVVEPVKDYNDFGQMISFMDPIGQDSWLRRIWFHTLRGKQKAFWFPSYHNDLELQIPIGASDVNLRVFTIGPFSFYVNKHIMIMLKNGTRFYRKINSALSLNSTVDQITISSSLGEAVAIEDIASISFMSLARLNADTVTFEHSSGDLVTTVVPIMEIPA